MAQSTYMTIKEQRKSNTPHYEIIEKDSKGTEHLTKIIRVPYVQVLMPDGSIRYIIYDEDYRPIPTLYKYLNENLRGYSPNTISAAVTALRLFVTFCTAYDIRDFVVPEYLVGDLVSFLRRSKTNSKTAYHYFVSITQFLKAAGHKDDPILDASPHTYWTTGADGNRRLYNVNTFDAAPKINHNGENMAPEYLTTKEAVAIYEAAIHAKDITGAIIILLEMKYGFRIGTILGLTIEDISTEIDRATGEIQRKLYLRNRLTDKKFQLVKNRIIPQTKIDYKHKDYISQYHHPHNCHILPEDLYDLLAQYFIKEHARLAQKYPNDYLHTYADTVNREQFRQDWPEFTENHYLFLNSRGNVLTLAAWLVRLERYYTNAGIPHHKSPNHAFRHGFAMAARDLGYDDIWVSNLLGQRNPASAHVYTYPSRAELAEAQKNVNLTIDLLMGEQHNNTSNNE